MEQNMQNTSSDRGEDDDAISLAPSTPPRAYSPDHEYVVEKILAEKNISGEDYFLVYWGGFPIEEASWEPFEGLKHLDALEVWEVRREQERKREVLPYDLVKHEALVAAFEAKRKQREEAKKKRRKTRSVDTSQRWSQEDDRILVAARRTGLTFPQIQRTHFPLRTDKACGNRYNKINKNDLSANEDDDEEDEFNVLPETTRADSAGHRIEANKIQLWSEEEDQILTSARRKGMTWPEIQHSHFPSRTVAACSTRYSYLKKTRVPTEEDEVYQEDSDRDDAKENDENNTSSLKGTKWTMNEDEILIDNRAQGMSYQDIQTKHFPFRTIEGCIKHHQRLVAGQAPARPISANGESLANRELTGSERQAAPVVPLKSESGARQQTIDSDSSDSGVPLSTMRSKDSTPKLVGSGTNSRSASANLEGSVQAPLTKANASALVESGTNSRGQPISVVSEESIRAPPAGGPSTSAASKGSSQSAATGIKSSYETIPTADTPTQFKLRDNPHIKGKKITPFRMGQPDIAALTLCFTATDGRIETFKFSGPPPDWNSKNWIALANNWHSTLIRRLFPTAKTTQSKQLSSTTRSAATRDTPVSASKAPSGSSSPGVPIEPVKQTAGRGQIAKRGGSKGYGNVFSSGTSRKQKPTLLETSTDLTKSQKHFSNMRIRHTLQIQSRNRADAAPDPDAVGGLYDPSNPTKLPPVRPSTLQRNTSSNIRIATDVESENAYDDDSFSLMDMSPNAQNGANITYLGSRPQRPTIDSLGPQLQEVQSSNLQTKQQRPSHHGYDAKDIICFFYHTRNNCARGYTCMYRHEDNPGLPIAPNPQLASTIPCKFFRQGSCQNPNCKFLHASKDGSSSERDVSVDSHGLFISDELSTLVSEPERITTPPLTRKVSFAVDDQNTAKSSSKPERSGSLRKSVSFADAGPPAPANPSAVPTHPAAFTPPIQHLKYAKTCHHFLNGNCWHGDYCRYTHSLDPSSSTTDKSIHSNSTQAESSPIPRSSIASTKPQILDLGAVRQETASGDLETGGMKLVSFGTEPQETFLLGFHGIEQALNSEWGAFFRKLPKLQFNQKCTVQDFESQKAALISQILWQGSTYSNPKRPSTVAVLKRVFEQLRYDSLGLISVSPDLIVLLYAPIAEWSFIAREELPIDSTSLQFMIFRTRVRLYDLLEPPEYGNSKSEFMRTLVRSVHSLSFTKLVPKTQKVVKDKTLHFFMLFPESAYQTASFFASWIASSSKGFKIYSSQTEGAWDFFVNSPEIELGIVLIHESAIILLPDMPGLLKLFTTRSDTFWFVSDSGSLHPLFDPPVDSTLGQTTVTRLLPHGHAVLLTPSLIVAEPDRVIRLLKWYHDKFLKSTSGTYKLVCAHGISTYLLDLALGKDAERDAFLKKHANDPKKDAMELAAGLTYKTCSERFQCYDLICELLALDGVKDGYSTFYDADNPNESSSPIIYVDESIDPDNEKAMTTWFAGWAHTKLDQFRRFTIVGTSASSAERAVRMKEIKIAKSPTKLAVKPFPIPKKRPSSSNHTPTRQHKKANAENDLRAGTVEDQVLDLLASAELDVEQPGSGQAEADGVDQNRRVAHSVPLSVVERGRRMQGTLSVPREELRYGAIIRARQPQQPRGEYILVSEGDYVEITGRADRLSWAGINKQNNEVGWLKEVIFDSTDFSTKWLDVITGTTMLAHHAQAGFGTLLTVNAGDDVDILRYDGKDKYRSIFEGRNCRTGLVGQVVDTIFQPTAVAIRSGVTLQACAPQARFTVAVGDRVEIRRAANGRHFLGRNCRTDLVGQVPQHIFQPDSNQTVLVKPGVTLQAYQSHNDAFRNPEILVGDYVDILHRIPYNVFMGFHFRSGLRVQVAAAMFKPPRPSVKDTETSAPVSKRSQAATSLPFPSANATTDAMDVDMPDASSFEEGEITLSHAEVAPLSPDEIVMKEYKFEATTAWYGRLKAAGGGWEHIYVEGWERCFKLLGVK